MKMKIVDLATRRERVAEITSISIGGTLDTPVIYMQSAAYDALFEQDPDLAPYLTPTSDGFDTVLGYCARNRYLPEDLGLKLGYKAKRYAKKEQAAGIRKVPAPEALRAVDIDEVNEYPLWVLNASIGPEVRDGAAEQRAMSRRAA